MVNANQIIFCVVCDRAGVVLEVLRDEFGLFSKRLEELHLHEVVDSASSSKVWNFLSELCEEKAVTGWTFNLPLGGSVETLHFAGACVNNTIVVVAGRSAESIDFYYDGLMEINSELANAVRNALKINSLVERGDQDTSRPLLHEMMELNNELTNTQRELAKRNAELAVLNEEKNRFLGMAAHDLRTPLNVIHGYSELLRDDWHGLGDSERLEMIARIARSGKYMLNLVDSFLDFARIESGTVYLDKRADDIVDVIGWAVEQATPLADAKRIKLQVEVPACTPKVVMDSQRIGQAILNLLTNAVKYSAEGSMTSVRVLTEADRVDVTVEDEGPGIPADEIPLLFRPFSRTSVKATGGEESTGLGLLIVKRIIDAHGGTVSVESGVGVGSRFTLSLPLQGR